MNEVRGVELIAKMALGLCAVLALVTHFFWHGEEADVLFLIALLFLVVAALTR